MNISILEEFEQITGYNIETFFDDYNSFVLNYYPLILDYYNGGKVDNDSFTLFDSLKSESYKIESLIDQYSSSFSTTEYWNLTDLFSDIQNSIYKVDVLYKWLRSSRSDRYSENIKIDFIQKQNQTLENISETVGFNDQDDWVDFSIQNQINEEDYTNKGGKLLKAFLPNNSNFELENIVDSLSEINIYGKDLVNHIEIDIIEKDLKILQGIESLNQTFGTIMSTIQGSIPEFPEDGVPDYLVGTNRNAIQYPVLFRSILSMIQKDKRFVSFEIIDINKDQDSIFMKVQVQTITRETFIENISL